jgi:hypothetical protein
MMIKGKHGAELSMNVIIIAAIALLVLVILAVLLFQSGGKVQSGTACDGYGGRCAASTPQDGDWIRNPAFDSSCNTGQCYVPLGKVQ